MQLPPRIAIDCSTSALKICFQMPYSHDAYTGFINGYRIYKQPFNHQLIKQTNQAVGTSAKYLKQLGGNELYTFRLKKVDLGFLFDYMYLVTNTTIFPLVLNHCFIPRQQIYVYEYIPPTRLPRGNRNFT